MIELLISACLSTGAGCRDVQFLYDPHEVSLMTCMVMGQSEVARWQQQNPNYQIRRWSCTLANSGEKSI